jgi:hypothetical protein
MDRNGHYSIRLGDRHPRSVTLPTLGTIRLHDDTRRLRRLLRPVQQFDPCSGEQFIAPRAKILFAAIVRRGDRWYVSLSVHAPDFHQQRRHQLSSDQSLPSFVGVDRGLISYAVVATADGTEVSRWPVPSHCSAGCSAYEVIPGHTHGNGGVRPTGLRPPVGFPASIHVSPTYGEPSSMRHPASSPRPTAGWLSRISKSPIFSPTDVWPELSAMLVGRSSPANSPTRLGGSRANWWSVTAGFRRPRPATPVGRSSNRWDWESGPSAVTAAASSVIGTETLPPTSPPGPSVLGPSGPPSRRPGHQSPWRERRWPSLCRWWNQSRRKGEPTLRPPSELRDIREGWRRTTSTVLDAL